MRLNNWLGLLYHTIIVVICGAIIWAMNHFAAEWGFVYNRLGVKIALTALPWILYFIFGGFLTKKYKRSLDFTSGLAILLIGIVVVVVAFAGHRMELLTMAPGQSMWTLPMDVFLLPTVLGLTVWGKGYEAIFLGLALVAPTVLFGIRRLLSAGKYREDAAEDQDDEAYESMEEVEEDAEHEALTLENDKEESIPMVTQDPVAAQETMKWSGKDLQEAEVAMIQTEAVDEEVKIDRAVVKGQQLSEEEIRMILAAREEKLRETEVSAVAEAPETMQQAQQSTGKSDTPEEILVAEPTTAAVVTEAIAKKSEIPVEAVAAKPIVMDAAVSHASEKEMGSAFEERPIPEFIQRNVKPQAEEVSEESEEDMDSGDRLGGIGRVFGQRKRRPSGRRMVVQQPETPEIVKRQEPRVEIEWRSHREGSSLKRPDVVKRADENFQAGGDEVRDILFRDKEQ